MAGCAAEVDCGPVLCKCCVACCKDASWNLGVLNSRGSGAEPFACHGRFKGNKEKGPAKQRIRDDSAKPQISELETNGDNKGGSCAKSGVRSAAKGPMGQAVPTIPLTSLTWTITVRTLRSQHQPWPKVYEALCMC